MVQKLSDGTPYAARHKYRDADTARRYQESRFHPSVARREERMVSRLMARCENVSRALDAPCGTGRMTGLLESVDAVAMDISADMLGRIAPRRTLHLVRGDMERLPFPDKSFDLVLSIRFLHHLTDENILERCLREMARVSTRYVLVSYYSTFALQHLRRILKNRRRERAQHRLSRPWKVFRAVAARAGLTPLARSCSAPGFSEQWFVLFEVNKND